MPNLLISSFHVEFWQGDCQVVRTGYYGLHYVVRLTTLSPEVSSSCILGIPKISVAYFFRVNVKTTAGDTATA